MSSDEIEVEEFHDEKETVLIVVTPRPAVPRGCSSRLGLISKLVSLVSEPPRFLCCRMMYLGFPYSVLEEISRCTLLPISRHFYRFADEAKLIRKHKYQSSIEGIDTEPH